MKYKPTGVVPPVVTPLTAEGKINENALRKVVNFLIGNGVHGLFPVGTTGEFYGLTDDEFKSVLEIVMDETKGGVPVYGGVNHITTRGAIRLAEIAEGVGVDAISVLTPMFISPTQNELFTHYEAISKSTKLPIILYNNKPKTGVDITPDTVAKLADLPNIVGVKDSTGDMTQAAEYIRLTKGKEFSVVMGRDTLIYAGLCYGATGAIAACANVAPRIVSDIYDKYVSGDLQGALDAQFKIAPLRIAFTIGTFPAVIKAGLEMQGIEAGECFAPVSSLNDAEKEKLKKILVEMGLI